MRAPARHIALAAASGALFAALAAGVQADRVGDFDEAVRAGARQLASPALTRLAAELTWLGGVAVLALFLAVAVTALIVARRRRDALFLIATMAGALALENALKFSFRRVRPPPFFGSAPATYSFPSGHALLSLCFYGGLVVVVLRSTRSFASRAGLWSLAIALVLAIGFTRIYLGVHYPSDVLGGYLVAISWLNLALAAEPRRGP